MLKATSGVSISFRPYEHKGFLQSIHSLVMWLHTRIWQYLRANLACNINSGTVKSYIYFQVKLITQISIP
jgi:hypothetical protein